MQTFLRKSLIVSGLALGVAVIGQNAYAGDIGDNGDYGDSGDSLRWQSVIGITQASNVVGSGTGAAIGAPGPWSALNGHVNVRLEQGKIDFDVRGLVFAGGNAIGTPGSVLQVMGTLICDTDGSASGGNSVVTNTPFVNLDDQGHAQFHGRVGALPSVCASEPDVAFLIRASTGRWIANGTVLR